MQEMWKRSPLTTQTLPAMSHLLDIHPRITKPTGQAMIQIKTTTQLIPGDVTLDNGLEFQVEQIIRLRKRSQIMFTAIDAYGNTKPFTVAAPNTKEWRVMQ